MAIEVRAWVVCGGVQHEGVVVSRGRVSRYLVTLQGKEGVK